MRIHHLWLELDLNVGQGQTENPTRGPHDKWLLANCSGLREL